MSGSQSDRSRRRWNKTLSWRSMILGEKQMKKKNKTMTLLITKKTENAFNLLFQKCLDISYKNKEECDYYRATWST